MDQNQARRYVLKKFDIWQYHLDVETTTVFDRVYQNAAPGQSPLSTIVSMKDQLHERYARYGVCRHACVAAGPANDEGETVRWRRLLRHTAQPLRRCNSRSLQELDIQRKLMLNFGMT